MITWEKISLSDDPQDQEKNGSHSDQETRGNRSRNLAQRECRLSMNPHVLLEEHETSCTSPSRYKLRSFQIGSFPSRP